MRVLVISPHPDDDAIGCGGTVRKHVLNGDRVETIYLTSGERGGHGLSPEKTGPLREREALASARTLGIRAIEFWREPNGSLRATERLVGRLRDRLLAWRPEIVYVTHPREMHPEHRAAARLMIRVIRQITDSSRPEVRAYEVWTPLQTVDEIVDITSYIAIKRAAIRAHKSQCRVVDFDQAATGLSRYRGELYCWPEGRYAEVFARLEAGKH